MSKQHNDNHLSIYQTNDYIRNGLIEFAKLGLQFLFLANGSAIIAILAHLPQFSIKNKGVLWLVLIIYILGFLSAFFATFSAYMSHRNLTEGINLDEKRNDTTWFPRALWISIVSFAFFAVGCIVSLCNFIT